MYIYRWGGLVYVYHAETIVYQVEHGMGTVGGFIGPGPTLLDGSGRKWVEIWLASVRLDVEMINMVPEVQWGV